MIARLSLISMLLVSSSMFSMETEYESIAIELNELDSQPDTTSNAHCISSLQHWREFARNNASLDDYEVLPKAVAEFKQLYEIKRDLPVSPEAVIIWERHQRSPQYAQEVSRIDAYLRSSSDTRANVELNELKNFLIKKVYEQSDVNGQKIIIEQGIYNARKQCSICLWITAVVLGLALGLELAYLPQ